MQKAGRLFSCSRKRFLQDQSISCESRITWLGKFMFSISYTCQEWEEKLRLLLAAGKRVMFSYLCIYFWLRWVFAAFHRLSPTVASGRSSSPRCSGRSLRWPPVAAPGPRARRLQQLWSGVQSWALKHRLDSCGAQASSCRSLLPGPQIKPVSPALMGRFFTTEPPGRPQKSCSLKQKRATTRILPKTRGSSHLRCPLPLRLLLHAPSSRLSLHMYFILSAPTFFCSSSHMACGCPCLTASHIPQVFVTPRTVAHQAPLSWRSPGENTGVGCLALLQGLFLTQG